jgi:uncharacterized protein DUF202
MAEEPRFIVKPSPESHFSWLRTRMSAERTLMSWVRTAISLIGFGFTIFQFLERLNTMTGAQPAEHPNAPWIFRTRSYRKRHYRPPYRALGISLGHPLSLAR